MLKAKGGPSRFYQGVSVCQNDRQYRLRGLVLVGLLIVLISLTVFCLC